MKNDNVNYYIEMYNYADLTHRWHEVNAAKNDLDLDTCNSWCKGDKELDSLRLEAQHAMNAYADALYQRMDGIRSNICGELYGLKKKTRFWNKIFKRKES